MKLLIYGAGVIGGLYAAAFAEAGYDTTVYARGKKLETLKTRGLLYEKNGKQYKAKVKVIGTLQNDDAYDFIFLTVKENQVHTALEELRSNDSSNIVTMVNTKFLKQTLRRLLFRLRHSPKSTEKNRSA